MIKAPGKFATVLLVALALLPSQAFSRNHRSAAVRREFMHEHPCPSTGKKYGSCKNYVVDHVIPLCKGGLDKISNMQWQTVADGKKKDRIECK